MRSWFVLVMGMGAVVACRSDEKPDTTADVITDTASATIDEDGDGYDSTEDCDDNNSLVHPGADELCDGADNNCNGQIDEGVTTTFYADTDGDGFGDPGAPIEACEAPEGAVAVANDCDDSDPESYPGAPEQCDGVDNDCDGAVDEDVVSEWYADTDGDGFGDPDAAIEDCDPPSGYSADATDCDDLNAQANPEAEEVCDEVDNDCDTFVDEDVTTTYYQDSDADGFGLSDATTESCTLPNGYADIPGDCDDSDGAVSPNATEVCDEIDNDCDGDIDEADAADASTWHADTDGDGYGDPDTPVVACAAPSGHVADSTDCDDSESLSNPGEIEVCDEIDNDCDGDTDEDSATDATVWYADNDGDGYGGTSSTIACSQPSGFADNNTDCDDGEPLSNPGEAEVCDEIDNDCDGDTDEGLTATYYADADGDGYGNSAYSTEACELPSGYVADDTDCDDDESASNPGETEICDELDNDCDGDTDEGLTATYYADADGDGYGNSAYSTEACEQPSGYVADDTDCDDGESLSNPGETEVCDELDNDCDGDTDEGVTITAYLDADGDGYGDVDESVDGCAIPSGYVSDDTDCDDGNGDISPEATEICDEIDNDCDALVDDDDTSLDTSTAATWYADSDGDGYGDASVATTTCDEPSGFGTDDTDCDDGNGDVYPGAAEICDGLDNNCGGDTDEGVLGTGTDCPAADCATILADNTANTDGTYSLVGDSGAVFETHCNMTDDGGGWTFIGSVVNDGSRSWDSYTVWTDSSTFGTLADRQGEDVRNEAFYDVSTGDDLLFVTDEYSFAFYGLIGGDNFADFVAAEYNTTACETNFLASGADWSDGLSTTQEAMQSFIVRPWDNNASCFPNGNENAIIGVQLASCCWTPGLGNTPSGYPDWEVYDLSLLQLSSLNPSTCTAGSYPCNDAGYTNATSGNCYTESCKVVYAELYVR